MDSTVEITAEDAVVVPAVVPLPADAEVARTLLLHLTTMAPAVPSTPMPPMTPV
jgi:hypothetical protein